MKIELPNGCYCSQLSVTPKNWKSGKASIAKDWFISYRFYDNGQVIRKEVRGMNIEKKSRDRAVSTQIILDCELERLKKGYNPITKITISPTIIIYEIEPDTPFILALDKSFARLKITKLNRYSIKSCLKWVTKSIRQLRFDSLQIDQVRRKHIKLILEQCEKNQPRWSAQTYNHYRAYLMMLFKELLELDCIDLNPVAEIKKVPIDKKLRELPTSKQRKEIDDYLKKHDPDYRRWLHIFFHSGARITELGKVKGKDVDLLNQRYKAWIRKRGIDTQVWKVIKTVALPFWIEIMQMCGPEDYLFSHGFIPGAQKPWPQYFTDRWMESIKSNKTGLGSPISLYTLKHLNLDETAAALNLEDAQAMADHTDSNTTLLYAQNEQERINKRLQKVSNPFA